MNSIGRIFRVTTWGESHGPAIGCVIDGCPAGLSLNQEDLQTELARDIPEPLLGTERHEPNEAQLLSGVFAGKTLGTPISILIYNQAQQSADYTPINSCYRPGHAEYGYHMRFGVYDPHGGGRASGRECISRICAGAVAKKLLAWKGIQIKSRVEQLAGVPCDTNYEQALQICLEAAGKGDSTGGIVSVYIQGVPAGLGSPVFEKLHALIMYAITTIGGVKGIESGSGFDAAAMKGSECNDPFGFDDQARVKPLSNRAGGVLGGISTGLDLSFRFAVKPTPSIAIPQQTVNWKTRLAEEIQIKGRFDKNITPRAAVVAEAMAAIILADQMLLAGFIHPTQLIEKIEQD